MNGYSADRVFEPSELKLWEKATDLVRLIPDYGYDNGTVRCHELTRAVAIHLHSDRPQMFVSDGKFGIVDHSWLEYIDRGRGKHIILDVYAVGSYPMVQLIDLDGSIGIQGARRYTEGPARTDIDENMVQKLVLRMNRYHAHTLSFVR